MTPNSSPPQASGMFRFLLVFEDGGAPDPDELVTAAPNWKVGETFLTGQREQFRILRIEAEIADELIDRGISAVFTVEAA